MVIFISVLTTKQSHNQAFQWDHLISFQEFQKLISNQIIKTKQSNMISETFFFSLCESLQLQEVRLLGRGVQTFGGNLFTLPGREYFFSIFHESQRNKQPYMQQLHDLIYLTLKPIGCAFTVINILKMNYDQTCMTVYGVIQKSDIKKRERQYQELIICPWDS